MGKKTPLRQVTFICSYMLFFFFAFCWNDRTYRKPHKEIKFNKIQDSSSLQNLLPNLLCRFKKHLWAIPCWNSYRKMPVFNLRKWIWLIIWSTRIYQKMRFNYCKEEIHFPWWEAKFWLLDHKESLEKDLSPRHPRYNAAQKGMIQLWTSLRGTPDGGHCVSGRFLNWDIPPLAAETEMKFVVHPLIERSHFSC